MAARAPSLKWRYIDNLYPSLLQKRRGVALTGTAAGVLKEFLERGLAITTVSDLLGEESYLYEGLVQHVAANEKERATAIEEARRNPNDPNKVKGYIFNVLGDRPLLDPSDPAIRFALSDPVLGIANGYMGMLTQIRHFNVWRTFPTNTDARDSQLWHRDPEDRQIVKCFIYLTDVDDDAGPLVYAPGTHPKGAIREEPEYIPGTGRMSEEGVAKVVPPERWITARGQAGTVIFADTRGCHKGGLVKSRERLMYTCMFTSSASSRRNLVDYVPPRDQDLSVPQRFALGW